MDLSRVQNLCEILDEHLEQYQILSDYIGQEKNI